MSARDRDSVWPGTASLVPEALRAAPSRLSPGKAGILALKRRRLVFRAASLLPGRPFVARVSPRRQHPVIPTRIAENIPVICARSFHASHDNSTRHGYLEMVAGGQTLGTRHARSEEHTSELQSLAYLVCRLLLEKKKKTTIIFLHSIINKKHET